MEASLVPFFEAVELLLDVDLAIAAIVAAAAVLAHDDANPAEGSYPKIGGGPGIVDIVGGWNPCIGRGTDS